MGRSLRRRHTPGPAPAPRGPPERWATPGIDLTSFWAQHRIEG
ncbi:hypothetical protein VSR01_27150 [Actinacidiphila sp. DG2A-62]|nr:hypothetical protein [Actinacidiphila sp. DG2A-62]MEC3996987.1 hypothetical protein [Actinacidiphila sp. DG2A-62]